MNSAGYGNDFFLEVLKLNYAHRDVRRGRKQNTNTRPSMKSDWTTAPLPRIEKPCRPTLNNA